MSGVTVELIVPIKAYGDEVREIKMRVPTGKDIRKCGVPFRSWSDDTGQQYNGPDSQAVASMISLLGDIPPGSVDELSAVDFLACMEAVTGFFNRSATVEPISSPDITMQHGDGRGAIRKVS
jgi:Phage tail assembly chaperone proteins, E, or 41 or 14